MTPDEATQHIERFLTTYSDPGITAKLEVWPERWAGHDRPPAVGYRIAEVNFHHASGGSSFMQVDIPDGAAACLVAERLAIALIEQWENEEIESEKERLIAACWGWRSPELKRFIATVRQ